MWEEIRYKPIKVLKINTLESSHLFPPLPSQAANTLKIKLLKNRHSTRDIPKKDKDRNGKNTTQINN